MHANPAPVNTQPPNVQAATMHAPTHALVNTVPPNTQAAPIHATPPAPHASQHSLGGATLHLIPLPWRARATPGPPAPPGLRLLLAAGLQMRGPKWSDWGGWRRGRGCRHTLCHPGACMPHLESMPWSPTSDARTPSDPRCLVFLGTFFNQRVRSRFLEMPARKGRGAVGWAGLGAGRAPVSRWALRRV